MVSEVLSEVGKVDKDDYEGLRRFWIIVEFDE